MKIILKCSAVAISIIMTSNIIVYAAPSSKQKQNQLLKDKQSLKVVKLIGQIKEQERVLDYKVDN